MRHRTAAAIAVAALATGCGVTPDKVQGAAAPLGAGATENALPSSTSPAGTPGGSPARAATSPATSPAAVPAGIPLEAMLRGPDWPSGRVRSGTTGVAALGQTEPSACEEHTAYPSDSYRQAARTVTIASDVPESGDVTEAVLRYAPGRATQAMAEMRRVLGACPGYDTGPGTRRYRTDAQGFAGDDSLLVYRTDRQTGSARDFAVYISVVRLGDALVSTTSSVGEAVADLPTAIRLAGRGVQRASCLSRTC